MGNTLDLARHAWGNGPPCILLVHGLGDGRFVWRDVETLLGAHFAGLSVDLRGHGDSPRDFLQRYDRDSLTADLGALVDSLHWPRFVLIGHSLGGELAVRLGAANPQGLRGIVIVDSGPELEREAAIHMQEEMASQPSRFATVAELEALLATRHPLAAPALLSHYANNALRACSAGGLELKFDSGFAGATKHTEPSEVWKLLRSIQRPLLLVRGRLSSMLSSRAALDVQHRLPNCRVVQVDNAGHGVPLENPRGLHDALLPFLLDVLPRADRFA